MLPKITWKKWVHDLGVGLPEVVNQCVQIPSIIFYKDRQKKRYVAMDYETMEILGEGNWLAVQGKVRRWLYLERIKQENGEPNVEDQNQ